MADTKSLEERLAAVERELVEIRGRLPPKAEPKNWVDQFSGSMKEFFEFDEVLRTHSSRH